jgi:hypothetical protein
MSISAWNAFKPDALRTDQDRITMNEQVVASAGSGRNEAHGSGVSWAAVIAGAFVAAALSLALLALGTGIGLSAVSPWGSAGASARTIGWSAIGWLVLMQLIACSAGGYLAGRLRTRWVSVHSHEVYFRDTAHGFLVWAVGLIVTGAFLASAAASMLGGAAQAGVAAVSVSDSTPAHETDVSNAYLVDTLLRSTPYSAGQDNTAARAEIGRIVAHSLRQGSLATADRAYIAQILAATTGASQSDAEQRVDTAYASAQQAAESARKAVAHSMYWTFLALLVGAFCASVAATIGGRQRDSVVLV